MIATTIARKTEADRLKTAFVNVIAVEAEQIPRSLTRQQIDRIAPSIPHISEAAIHRYSEAEQLYLRSLSIRESVYGQNHTEVANSFYNLAGFYVAQGRYGDAEVAHLKSQAILTICLGDDDRITVMVKRNFSDLLTKILQEGQRDMLSDSPITQQVLQSIAFT